MTERSRPWDGTATGDATDSPYDAGTEWARMFRALAFGSETTADKGGPVMGAVGFNDYAATTPSANVARIATGIGWNQGTWHESDATVDFAIPTPAASTRVDRIVLRKGWVAQTVRLTRIAGVEGAGAPAMTQVFGTTWDVPLWRVSITTGGVITFIDDRHSVGAGNAILSDPAIMGQTIISTGAQILPTVTGNSGKWRFYKATSASLTVTPATGEALWAPGETAPRATNVTYVSPAGESTSWYCNGTNWACL